MCICRREVLSITLNNPYRLWRMGDRFINTYDINTNDCRLSSGLINQVLLQLVSILYFKMKLLLNVMKTYVLSWLVLLRSRILSWRMVPYINTYTYVCIYSFKARFAHQYREMVWSSACPGKGLKPRSQESRWPWIAGKLIFSRSVTVLKE